MLCYAMLCYTTLYYTILYHSSASTRCACRTSPWAGAMARDRSTWCLAASASSKAPSSSSPRPAAQAAPTSRRTMLYMKPLPTRRTQTSSEPGSSRTSAPKISRVVRSLTRPGTGGAGSGSGSGASSAILYYIIRMTS